MRRQVRDAMRGQRLLSNCVSDLRTLLIPESEDHAEDSLGSVIELWDEQLGRVSGGTNYGEDVPW